MPALWPVGVPRQARRTLIARCDGRFSNVVESAGRIRQGERRKADAWRRSISLPMCRGFKVGHAGDLALGSGTTVILCETPAVASVDVRGGSPGTRETDLLSPGASVDRVDDDLSCPGARLSGSMPPPGPWTGSRPVGEALQSAPRVSP